MKKNMFSPLKNARDEQVRCKQTYQKIATNKIYFQGSHENVLSPINLMLKAKSHGVKL